jgi:zinc/manganese transport system permease protein
VIALADPFAGLAGMLALDFVRNALLAGTVIGAAAGLVGYFLVLRSQVFTADALSHVAFTGALFALLLGLDARIGLFAATIGVGLLLGLLGPRGRADDVVIGSTFAWVLGLGVLALSLFTTRHSATDGGAGTTILFGSIFGLDGDATRTAVLVGAAVIAATLAIARPLLFGSVDEAVAAARGVPVRLVSLAFLAIVGATAAETTQAVGALLLLALLAAPAGIAARLTTRPYVAMALSTSIAVSAVWGGIALSYAAPSLPPSFTIVALLTAGHVSVLVRMPIGQADRRGRAIRDLRARAVVGLAGGDAARSER